MKHTFNYCILFAICFIVSCKKETSEPIIVPDEEIKQKESLPFTEIPLNDLSSFKPTGTNWKVVGGVIADRNEEKGLTTSDGSGVLVNMGDAENNEHIFTSFEHGDIELELDVMMPKNSNSGLYFQGRYEIQLFDSWGVKEPKYSDIGDIYQRWDETKENGKNGYEGTAPSTNTAKAPGLWQHFKIIFHAPKFDESGNKTKNAWFEEVWLNGVLIQNNVEVTGPTQAAMFNDEKPTGPFVIQGDHGAVAFKNIKYKLYGDNKVAFSNLVNKEYEGEYQDLINMDSLKLVSESKVEKLDLSELKQSNSRKIVSYSGTMEIPTSGDYLFEMGLNGGGIFIVNNDTLINLNEDLGYAYERRFAEIVLEQGSVPFNIVYNKKFPWRGEFNLQVEGPEIQKQTVLQEEMNTARNRPQPEKILIEPKEDIIAQRTFLMHKGTKKVYSISVGSPIGIHYAFDLSRASLLMAWNGSFLDATPMWDSRGESQLVEPNPFHISSHGDFEFAFLENENSQWPGLDDDVNFKQLGYEFDEEGYPVFLSEIAGATITNKFIPSASERKIDRKITVAGNEAIWYKIADGEHIEALPNKAYRVDGEGYYINFSSNSQLTPIIREVNGNEELIVKVPSGKQSINYSIIW